MAQVAHQTNHRFRISPAAESAPQISSIKALVMHLSNLGVEQAFGVSGGAIALVFDALSTSAIGLHHFRHEAGAAFAATEAYFADGKPTVIFATTGPGILNSLTGLVAARWDGAKVILISGATSHAERGRWATQETSSYTMPQDALYSQGPIFDYAVRMEHPAEMPVVIRRLAMGLARPGGFVAHICLPMAVQSSRMEYLPSSESGVSAMPPTVNSAHVAACAKRLKSDPFVLWLGFGATRSASLVRRLVDHCNVKVMCSPRAKGIVSEEHPKYLGVTGVGGHESVVDYMATNRPKWVLVLGSRLGEATSFWDPTLVPTAGFIHVDINPEVPGTAYPEINTIAVQAEISQFVEELLKHFPDPQQEEDAQGSSMHVQPGPLCIAGRGPVRPQELMRALQRQVVEETEALVMSDCGNSFVWCNHYLRFQEPNRYRVNTLFGSMGHFASGVVGAALARRGKAVAVVGDGSMLMNSEISTAVQYEAQAVWVVLNDGGYKICENGHRALGLATEDLSFTQVDFVGLAKSMGADGMLVEGEEQLDQALEIAMESSRPFVIDVRIDATQSPPLSQRFKNLLRQADCGVESDC